MRASLMQVARVKWPGTYRSQVASRRLLDTRMKALSGSNGMRESQRSAKASLHVSCIPYEPVTGLIELGAFD